MAKNRIFYFLLVLSILNVSSAFSDSLEIFSPKYFGEEKNVYENIHYLKNEPLSFQFCSDDEIENMKAQISCKFETKDITLNKNQNKKNCYFSNYDLTQTSCEDFSLDINYKVNNKEKKIKRSFVKQIESKLINHVLNLNPTSLNPLDLSYYLTVLSEIETTQSSETQKIYDLLKNNRDNGNKCWPKGKCETSQTVEILNNVKLSNYELKSRILEDGKTYLEKKYLSNNNTALEFLIDLDDPSFENESNTITCEIKIDDDTDDYDFDEDHKDYEDKVFEKVIFTCNETVENIDFNLFGLDGRVKDIKEFINKTGFTYEIEDFSCISEGTKCSYINTINALSVYSSNLEDSSELEAYINDLIETKNGETYLDTSDSFRDIGKYLFYKSDSDLKDYLKFKQNNDGSWGSQKNSNRIEKTVWSILGLQKIESSSENVEDGKKWIYYNEPTSGWGSLKLNALSYMAIKEQIKPYLKISTKNRIEGVEIFSIENPTIFDLRDLEIKLSEEIIDDVSFLEDIGDIDPEEIISFNLSISNNLAKAKTGFMEITGVNSKGKRIDLIKMPITIDGNFNIEYVKEDYIISEDDTKIKIKTIIPSGYTASCEIIDPFTTLKMPVSISAQSPTIILNNQEMKEGEFSTKLTCKVSEQEIEIDIDFSVKVVKKVLQTSVEEIIMDKFKDVSFEVTSLQDEDIELSIEVTEAYGGILIPVDDETITLKARSTKKLKFLMGDTTFLELVGEGVKGAVKLSTKDGFEKQVHIVREATGANDSVELEESGGRSIWFWIIVFVLLLLIGFAGLVFYRYKQLQKMQEEEPEDGEEEIF